MARLNVNPTRIELKNLKNNLKVASRGHKLLKDKSDELIRLYTAKIRSCYKLKVKIQKEFLQVLMDFNFAKGYNSNNALLQEFILQMQPFDVEFSTKKQLNLTFPNLKISNTNSSLPYAYASTDILFDDVLLRAREVAKDLLTLAELEKSCQILSHEIEFTRRRVNALEHVLMPNLSETISFITMKIDENDRAFNVRLTKTKIKK